MANTRAKRTIWVSGLPRSGTTWFARELSTALDTVFLPECSFLTKQCVLHRDTRLYSDAQRFDAYLGSQEALQKLYSRALREQIFLARTVASVPKSRHVVLKDPLLSEVIEELELLFPDHLHYAVIREPLDVVASLKRVHMRKGLDWTVESAFRMVRDGKYGILRAYERSTEYTKFIFYESIVSQSEFPLAQLGLETPTGRRKARSRVSNDIKQKLDSSDPFFSELYFRPTTSERIGAWKAELTTHEAHQVREEFAEFRTLFGYAS